ncbi:hypothetical protein AVEN_229752-1 [Araneus ventricosus]|uniref:Transposable element P transposase-like RNase H C-terminal domain-containing protein n=1 Tax=Araneus ventricosus TaxID=182803 RepID=A0A4Y2MG50_ARAVE|nr:hypothetical protein AVEN_229752-1 [Araneus ventricosus]
MGHSGPKPETLPLGHRGPKRKGKSYLPFQKGFSIPVASLYGSYGDLKPLNVKFILTSRLNQDCLENFFSQIRSIGHFYDHPLPSEEKHLIRMLLFGKNGDDIPFSSSANTLQIFSYN